LVEADIAIAEERPKGYALANLARPPMFRSGTEREEICHLMSARILIVEDEEALYAPPALPISKPKAMRLRRLRCVETIGPEIAPQGNPRTPTIAE